RGLTVLSAPPPQTGMRVLHTLELLEGFNLAQVGLPMHSATAFDILTSALRVGQAGAMGNGDPNWMDVPAVGTASQAFAATRRALVGTGRAVQSIERADATTFESEPLPPSCAMVSRPMTTASPVPLPAAVSVDEEVQDDDSGETTHISVVDG